MYSYNNQALLSIILDITQLYPLGDNFAYKYLILQKHLELFV